MTCTACEQPFDALFPARLPPGELHAGEPICQPCRDFRFWAELADVDWDAARRLREDEPGNMPMVFTGCDDE